jgi:hypothetical protein
MTSTRVEERCFYTRTEVKTALFIFERYRLRFPIFGAVTIHFRVSDSGNAIVMEMEAQVPERTTGNTIHLRDTKHFDVGTVIGRSDSNRMVAHLIRQALIDFMRHEIDEMLECNGRSVFDPHKGDP